MAGGVDAAEAWAAGDILPPLPGLPQAPGTPPSPTAAAAPAPGAILRRWPGVPGGVALARACAALEAAWEADERPPFHSCGHRWTVPGGLQLRRGRDGRWWPCREEGEHWIPAGGPEPDPATALAARLGAEPEAEEDR